MTFLDYLASVPGLIVFTIVSSYLYIIHKKLRVINKKKLIANLYYIHGMDEILAIKKSNLSDKELNHSWWKLW